MCIDCPTTDRHRSPLLELTANGIRSWYTTTLAGLISLWFGLGYLCGSVPFGILVARIFGLGNLREIGSGNIGATNVLRTGSKPAAAATLLLDALKGTLPVIVAMHVAGIDTAIAAGFGAFVGHILPIWLNFKGGKGVATYVGVLLGFGWPLLAVFAVIWLTLAVSLRYSSLAALVASLAVPGYALYAGNGNWPWPCWP